MPIFLLIIQIGVKPDNLIFTDLGKYHYNYFFLTETPGEQTASNSNNPSLLNNLYGGVIGGTTGAGLGFIGGMLLSPLIFVIRPKTEAIGPAMAFVGGAIGSLIGGVSGIIWGINKSKTKKGSLTATIIGTVLGTAGFLCVLDSSAGPELVIPGVALPLLGGLIGYRLTLK